MADAPLQLFAQNLVQILELPERADLLQGNNLEPFRVLGRELFRRVRSHPSQD